MSAFAVLRAVPLRIERRRLLSTATGVALVAAFFIVLPRIGLHTQSPTGRLSFPLPAVLLGVIIGLTYGLLSVGLVLIYRTNRIINFAHGNIGAFGAAFFGIAVVRWHIEYWFALPIALALAGGVGATAEAAVVRRLRKAPLIMSVVATLGVGQFLVLFAFAFNNQAGAGARYPMPAHFPSFPVGALTVTPAYFGMLVLSPTVVIALAIFLKVSRFGLALRSAAANPEAARMAGIFASRMSSLAWAIAGGIAALTAILTQPTEGFSSPASFGPSLLLRALTPAVIARMSSLPVALLAGTGLGVVEQLLLWNYPESGLVEMTLFVVILATLLIQRPRGGRTDEKGSWSAVQGLRPLPEAIRRVRAVRHLGTMAAIPTLAIALVIPIFTTNANSVIFTGIFAFTIVAMSVAVVTGLGGQLSLGQFALASIGAVVSFEVSRRTGNFFESFLYAGLAAAAVSLVIGLPALRVRGLLLTVTTLSFALATDSWLLQQSWMLGSGQDPGRPILFHHALETGKQYYYVGLATLLVVFWLVRNIRRGGIGRRLVAVRDNEDNARAFTVPAAAVKIQGFLLAGFIAGLGGAMYGHSLASIGSESFPSAASVNATVMAVIGGLGVLAGPLLGALLVQGIPSFWSLGAAGLAATAFGQLLILMYLPGGLASLVAPLRNRVAHALARRAGVDVAAAYAETSVPAAARAPTLAPGASPIGAPAGGLTAPDPGEAPAPPAAPIAARVDQLGTSSTLSASPVRRRHPGTVLLEARGLRKSFGGVRAVRGVSFEVRAGETLGLIGPNGAGKTTTFELLGGFTRADAGSVRFDGRDVTGLGPEARGRLGLIRSFQDAALFPTMTVLETIQTALERVAPTRVMANLLGFMRAERRKEAQARALVTFMGLDAYRDKQIQELSTGTRRIAEIACLVALQPSMLLLDEPSSGVAQRETEALGALLTRLKDALGLTLVVIEHDIPLIMRISDRIIAMADGQVIAAGTPQQVRTDPLVVEAYLGGSLTAIERSGALGSTATNGTGGRATTAVAARVATAADPLPGELLAVAGLGVTRAAALMSTFGSIEALRRASLADLTSVRGVGHGLARRVHEALR
ncbi:MAG TPA: ATP-binding cassette domain-containing protein [Mycobacteriales bacterium]|nr:ATP-binding cassette domain-containing protein [Mycobacteriales bacterium]